MKLRRMSKMIIVTADDFGYGPERDEGILSAFRSGLVTRTSLLVNGKSALQGARLAKEAGLPLGLHLNLTEGQPMAPKTPRSELVDRESKMFLGVARLFGTMKGSQVDQEELEEEIVAQFEKFKALCGGALPLYVDGHNHVQVLRPVALALGKVMKRYGVDEVRIPKEAWLSKSFLESISEEKKQFYEEIITYAETVETEVYTALYGLSPTSDGFIGISLMGQNLDHHGLSYSLLALRSDCSSVELMVHPGNKCDESKTQTQGCGQGPDMFSCSEDREWEKDALCSNKMKSVLDDLGYEPVASAISNQDRTVDSQQKSPHIVLISSLTQATGNLSTCKRLSRIFQNLGYGTSMIHASEIGSIETLQEISGKTGARTIVALNAKRCGEWLVSLRSTAGGDQYKMILIIGGTDVNTDHISKSTRDAFLCVDAVVSFNEELKNRVIQLLGEEESKRLKIHLIPQGFDVEHTLEQTKRQVTCGYQGLRMSYGLEPDAVVLLLPSGLRPVKDPSFLLEEVKRWHREEENERMLYFLIVGPSLDPEETDKVVKICNTDKSLLYCGSVSHVVMLKMMVEADVIVNSSISEGMSCAIMEAMAIGVPVVARKNEGNCSLLKHMETGLLFDTPQEFRTMTNQLLKDVCLREKIVNNARRAIDTTYAIQAEQDKYEHLLRNM